MEAVDTHTIPFDIPVASGFNKIFKDNFSPPDVVVSESKKDEYCSELNEDSQLLIFENVCPDQVDLKEWFANQAWKISKSLINVIAATQIDIARLTFDGRCTAPSDVAAIVRMIPQNYIVSVSPSLIMSRSEVHASSLLAPSGFRLAWMAMFGDEVDDNE